MTLWLGFLSLFERLYKMLRDSDFRHANRQAILTRFDQHLPADVLPKISEVIRQEIADLLVGDVPSSLLFSGHGAQLLQQIDGDPTAAYRPIKQDMQTFFAQHKTKLLILLQDKQIRIDIGV